MVKMCEAGIPIQNYRPSIANYEPPISKDARLKRGDRHAKVYAPMLSLPPAKRTNVYMVSILSYPEPENSAKDKKRDERPALLLSPVEGGQCSLEVGDGFVEVYSREKDGIRKADLQGRLVQIDSLKVFRAYKLGGSGKYAVYAVFSDPKTHLLRIAEVNQMANLDPRSSVSIGFFIGLRDEPLLKGSETVKYGGPMNIA